MVQNGAEMVPKIVVLERQTATGWSLSGGALARRMIVRAAVLL